MKTDDLKARLKELYLPTTKDFVFVDVPDMQYVMIDGEGNPDGARFKHAVRWLFTARLARLDEGRCVQIMHIGDYSKDAAALARRLHHEFLPQHDLVVNGHHHEIYLSDPNRVAPARMRTVLRQPVR